MRLNMFGSYVEPLDVVYRHQNGFFIEGRVEYTAPDGSMLVWVDRYMDTRNVMSNQVVWRSDEEPALIDFRTSNQVVWRSDEALIDFRSHG